MTNCKKKNFIFVFCVKHNFVNCFIMVKLENYTSTHKNQFIQFDFCFYIMYIVHQL